MSLVASSNFCFPEPVVRLLTVPAQQFRGTKPPQTARPARQRAQGGEKKPNRESSKDHRRSLIQRQTNACAALTSVIGFATAMAALEGALRERKERIEELESVLEAGQGARRVLRIDLGQNMNLKAALEKVLEHKEKGVIAWDEVSLGGKGLLEVLGVLARRVRALVAP